MREFSDHSTPNKREETANVLAHRLLYDCGTGGPVAFVNEYFDHVPYD
jgi:hypothetical protein